MAQRGTGQLRVRAPILLPGLWGGGDLHGELHGMLSHNRQGSRKGAKPRFVAARPSSLYIEQISCILCMLSV